MKEITAEPMSIGTTALDVRDASDQAVALMKKRVENQQEMLKIAISLTGTRQWTRFGDSIYPTGGAADTILRRAFGLTWSEKKVTVDETGEHATVTAALMLHGEPVEEFTGYRSMGGFIKNRADLIKGAMENLKSVAVRDLLGLRFRTPEELKALGLDPDKIETQVDFQTHDKDPNTIVVPFGRDKGKPITEVDDACIQWLADAVKNSIDDPSKAKWKDKNQAMLDALRAEYKRRNPGKKKKSTKKSKAAEQEGMDFGPPPLTDEEVEAMEAREPGQDG